MSLNSELADLFARMASIMEIKGEVLFKVIAFQKISRLLKDSNIDLRRACEANELGKIEGIGKSSQKIIEQYIATGKCTDFEQLSASIPPGLPPLLEIPGLGPKTIAMLWKQRQITNEAELVKAIENGALDGIKGLGDKKIDAIKKGIAFRAQSVGRIGIGEALPIAEEMARRLRQFPRVKQVEVAGSLRRRRETVGDVDLLCALSDTKASEEVSGAFVKFPEVARILGQGSTKTSVQTDQGLQVDLRMVPMENFGAAMLYFTGSKDHNVKLRQIALKKEMTLNEWGLYRVVEYQRGDKKTAHAPTAKPVASKTEIDVYAALDLPFIDPEMREDRGEITAALEKRLPRLVTRKDIKGDLHTHTTASDGTATIEQMARAAMERGYQYLAITDHSKSQVIARGLTAERLLNHIVEIRRVEEKLDHKIALLAGCEVDILADGALDFGPEVLRELDIVIASPHISLKQDRVKATERLLRAIDARYVNVIGHPTGRLINSREGLPLDFSQLFKLAAVNGTAMEINAGYPRLDLDEFNARAAIDAGVMLAINTDAHGTEGFDEIDFGLGVARRAWVSAGQVLNCHSLPDLKKFLARKR